MGAVRISSGPDREEILMEHEATSKSVSVEQVDAPASESRRGFLQIAALTGAVAAVSGRRAWANGDIGFHAKDLSDDKLVEMYRTILKIRWHERTQAGRRQKRAVELADPHLSHDGLFIAGDAAVVHLQLDVAVGLFAELFTKPRKRATQLRLPGRQRRKPKLVGRLGLGLGAGAA